MTERIWILGATDPEMKQIEELLQSVAEAYCYAHDGHGRRCTPQTAYHAFSALPAARTIILVECDGPGVRPQRDGNDLSPLVVIIDHHAPGHPGYGIVPEQFFLASSIGQAYAALIGYGRIRPDTPVPEDILFCAAADHCLSAAYQGRCPGIDPAALMRWRVDSRSLHQKRLFGDVIRDIEQTASAFSGAAHFDVAGHKVLDMRRETPWPELPEAAARYGISYISGPIPSSDGRQKITCSSPHREVISAFLGLWGEGFCLHDRYGDAERGFAGGYLYHGASDV